MISTLSSNVKICQALKEWAIAVEALEAGETIMLLRKGGIREVGGHFQAKYRQVWLYPTYEHQQPQSLKPKYAAAVDPVASGWHPETVAIGSFAEITEVLLISDRDKVKALQNYYVWSKKAIEERLNWKSEQPLFILLLRVYLLPEPQIIPFDKTYRGCRSWIDLVTPLSLSELTPVLDEYSYQKKVKKIIDIVKTS